MIPIVTKRRRTRLSATVRSVTAGATTGLTVGNGAFCGQAGRPALRSVHTRPHHRRQRSAPRLRPRRELPRGRAGHLRQRRQPEHHRALEHRGRSQLRLLHPHRLADRDPAEDCSSGSDWRSCGALCVSGTTVCGLAAPAARGESHRLVPTDQGGVREDTSPRFNPQNGIDVNLITDTITLPYNISGIGHRRPGAYSAPDGQAIGGLQSGQTYYAIGVVSPANSTTLQPSATKGRFYDRPDRAPAPAPRAQHRQGGDTPPVTRARRARA